MYTSPPGAGKSMVSLYQCICLATGSDFLQFSYAEKVKCLYIDQENRWNALYTRLRKITEGMGLEPEDYKDHLQFCVTQNMKLNSGYRVNESLVRLEKMIKDWMPKIVVLDSLVRFITGDENSASEMKEVFSVLDYFIKKYSVSFIILHHSKKNGTGKMEDARGSGDLLAMCDDIFNFIKPEDSEILEVKQTKNRHEEKHKPFAVKFIDDESSFYLDYKGEKSTTLRLSIRDDIVKHYDNNMQYTTQIGLADYIIENSKKNYTQRTVRSVISEMLGDGDLYKDDGLILLKKDIDIHKGNLLESD